MSIWIVISLVWIHFVADFVLQSDKMAKGKSTSNKWLGIHVVVYSLPFIIISPLYALINGIMHFMTDYVSSRNASRFLAKGDHHNFFIIVGIDQAVHITTLLMTYNYLFII